MKRLYLIVDDHLDIDVLLSMQIRDRNSDVTHGFRCLRIIIDACTVG